MRLVSAALLLLLLVLLLLLPLAGCWPSDDRPPSTAGTCNSNGVCELNSGEDCTSCAVDCPCCHAVEAKPEGDVSAHENALGAPDTKSASLGQSSSLRLLVGSAAFDGEGSDVLLDGEVSTDSSIQVNSLGCPLGPPMGPGFRVDASYDGSEWKLLGYWTQTVQGGAGGFDLACAKLKSAIYFRLTALPGAAATLNALTAVNCAGSPPEGNQ